MKTDPKSIPIERYIAIDIHKHYVVLGGMDPQKEWVLRIRKVRMSRFPEWVLKNLKLTDAVVCKIRSMSSTDSGACRPLIPEDGIQ